MTKITHMQEGKRFDYEPSMETKKKLMLMDECVVAIFMLDSVTLAQIERIAYKCVDLAKEEGLYRHLLKKSLNDIKKKVVEKRRSMDGNGLAAFMELNYMMLPQAKKRYIECGGNAEDHLISSFIGSCGDVMANMEEACVQFTEKLGLQHHRLFASLSAIMALCAKNKEIHDYQIKLMKGMFTSSDMMLSLGGRLFKYADERIEQARTNERVITHMMKLAADSIHELMGGNLIDVERKEELHLAKAFNDVRDEMGGETMMKVVGSMMDKVIMEYSEFFLACLRQDMEHPEKIDKTYRETIARLVGEERVDELMDELRVVEPMRDDEDLIDLSMRLPESDGKSVITHFRKSVRHRMSV